MPKLTNSEKVKKLKIIAVFGFFYVVLVWIGDLYSEMQAACAVYGDLPEIRALPDFCRKETALDE